MSSIESIILSYLLNSLWQVPLLFAAGWVAARSVRRMGAAAEHRVWAGVIVLQAAIPAACSLPSAWFPAFAGWRFTGAAQGGERVTAEMGSGFALAGGHLNTSLLALATLVYCALTTYFFGRFLWRCARLAQIRRSAAELILSRARKLLWQSKLQRLKGEATLATSENISAPVTIGIRRRLVLLPASMVDGLAEADFETILDHELAHIERADFARNLVYEALAIPLNYHPLLRLSRVRMVETREMACDDRAAEARGPMEYGRSLLRLASMLVQQPYGMQNAIGIFDANTLERRVMRLKNRQREMSGGRRIAALFACGLLAAATCASALALHMSVDAGSASGAESAQPEKVPAGEIAGNLVSKVMPKYPPEAKKKKVQGKVVLNATISEQGDVKDLKVQSGPQALRKSALDAVKQWKYRPYLHNGKPVEVETTINVFYSLVDGPAQAPPKQ